MSRHPAVDAAACSAIGIDLGEPLAATSPHVTRWIIVEQPGPWGAKALLDSHLADPAAQRLRDLSAEPLTTVLLARRPGPHADRHDQPRQRVWVASFADGWALRTATMTADELVGLDPQGDFGDVDQSAPMFLCTNAKRDLCCALAGRSLLAELVAEPLVADRLWECSHLGGHRFAPTALVPSVGAVYGRLTRESATAAAQSALVGDLELASLRGESAFDRPLQAAIHATREHTGVVAASAFTATRTDDATCVVAHADGRRWSVAVRQVRQDPARPESCGGDPGSPVSWIADQPKSLPHGE